MTTSSIEYVRAYREKNRELLAAKQKAYYAANRERIRAEKKAARLANPEAVRAKERAYAERTREQKRARAREYYERNKDREREKRKAWEAANPEKVAAMYLRRHLRQKYQLSHADYLAMVEVQGGKCAICQRTPAQRLQVDHDHATGKLRQLLCGPCNRLLGFAEDDTDRLRVAIAYLERHR